MRIVFILISLIISVTTFTLLIIYRIFSVCVHDTLRIRLTGVISCPLATRTHALSIFSSPSSTSFFHLFYSCTSSEAKPPSQPKNRSIPDKVILHTDMSRNVLINNKIAHWVLLLIIRETSYSIISTLYKIL